MNFSFTEEQDELRAMARSFLADHSSGDHVRVAMASDAGHDPAVWKQIGQELGWCAVTVPEEYGGLGLGFVELVALLELTGEYLLCGPFFSTVALGINALGAAGTEEQKQELLPQLAEGAATATLALTEPSGRWGLDAIALVARAEGDGFVLSGTKRYVPDGASADWIVVAARNEGSEGAEGISLFLVPGDAPGLTRIVLPTMDQTRRQAELRFEDVRVDGDALMGAAGQAGAVLESVLDRAAIATAAEQVGGAQRCLDLSVEYAKERVQFGRPIASFQSIKHKCADMMVKVESARSAVYYAACAGAEESPQLPQLASLAKAYCSDAYFYCAGTAIQIFGGVGFTWEYDPHLYFKRAKSSEEFLGAAPYHRERVARLIGV